MAYFALQFQFKCSHCEYFAGFEKSLHPSGAKIEYSTCSKKVVPKALENLNISTEMG